MRAMWIALVGMLLFSCSVYAAPREERIGAAMLHVEEVPEDWHQSTDTTTSAKPACVGTAYWRTFRPEGGMGRFQLVQHVVFDCATALEGERVFRIFTQPMLRTSRASVPLLGGYPAHADDFAAYCEFNLVGGSECKVLSRYGGLVSQIYSIHATSVDDWPSEQELLVWGVVRLDESFRKFGQ